MKKIAFYMCQFLIGNVSQTMLIALYLFIVNVCQFLIGNVSLSDPLKDTWKLMCQFLIGNVSLPSIKKIMNKVYNEGVNSS